MKKGLIFGISVLFLIFAIGIVSAGPYSEAVNNIASFLMDIVQGLRPVLDPLLGDTSAIGESFDANSVFLAKIVIFIILMSVIYTIGLRISLLNSTPWVIWMVALGIPLLTVRFITSKDVLALVLPSTALGVAIMVILPLVLYFFFVESFESKTLRRIAWVLGAFVFLGIYVSRYNELYASRLYWSYLGGVIFCIVMFALDGTIKSAWKRIGYENRTSVSEARIRASLTRQRAQLETDYANGAVTRADYITLDADLKLKERKYGIK